MTIPLDQIHGDFPYEEWTQHDPASLESFADRVARAIEPLVAAPLVRQFWPSVLDANREEPNLGKCLARSRHRLERAWGSNSYELPLSQLCECPEFHWFAAFVLARIREFHAVYNACLRDYRRANRIRSPRHPVPDLAVDGDWWEAPFWIWSREHPLRRRVFVQTSASGVRLSDRAGYDTCLPLFPAGSAERAVEQMGQFAVHGVRFRPRALTTTLFVRLFLSDVFVHGIGGGKYDQVTDSLVTRFFGLSPPPYFVATATLRLPITIPPATRADVLAARQRVREIRFHPERFLPEACVPEVAELAAEKQRWLADDAPRGARRARHLGIDRINQALQPWLDATRAEWVLRERQLVGELSRKAILGSREFSFCLHPEESLRSRLLEISASAF